MELFQAIKLESRLMKIIRVKRNWPLTSGSGSIPGSRGDSGAYFNKYGLPICSIVPPIFMLYFQFHAQNRTSHSHRLSA